MSTRAFHRGSTERTAFYPRVFGARGAVVAQHYLAADAGLDILKAGGNAIDAAVAAVWVESLVDPHMFTIGGETPMLIKLAAGNVLAINGNTRAPRLATPESYAQRGLDRMPDSGILAAGVPAAPGALITALARFGSLSLQEVTSAVRHYARQGFPIHTGLLQQERFGLRDCERHFRDHWPASAELYLPDGQLPAVPASMINPAYADLLEHLVCAERQHAGNRAAKLEQVYRTFYRGEPASCIARFSRTRDGLLALSDLEDFETLVEPPAATRFGNTTVHKCGAWSQGPVLLQTLNILATRDLASLGHNSAPYIHFVVEAMNLAFADREQYYADSEFVDVPLAALLSAQYAAQRAELIRNDIVSPDLRPGDPHTGEALLAPGRRLGGKGWGAGTVHVGAMDAEGNVVSATPSGGWFRSNEVMAELGFPLGNRLMTFHLGPSHHPNVVAPFKRPRTTLSPSLVTRADESCLAFGSMGGDQQDQWQLQFLLNRLLFGMTLQEAIEAPKFSSEHFPGSSAAAARNPRRLRIESTVPADVLAELTLRGHDIDVAPAWSEGYLLALERHTGSKLFEAACDPRSAKTTTFAAAVRVY